VDKLTNLLTISPPLGYTYQRNDKNMRSIAAITLLALSCSCAQADVSFVIDALNLRTSTGAYMPLGGQILLVADTGANGFIAPTATSPLSAGSFLSGDDLILQRWSLTGTGNGGDNTPGIGYFAGATPSIALTGGLTAGDVVRLYWFPTLTSGSTSPGELTEYGFYYDTGLVPPQDGSEAWTVPNDANSRALLFLTADYGGAYAETVGWASHTVAPIPEASNLIFAGLALGVCVFRLTCGARQKLITRVR